MVRRSELPAEAVSLDVLARIIEERRQGFLEKMGDGMTEAQYREHVGRNKEDKWLIDQVNHRLKQLHAGDDQ